MGNHVHLLVQDFDYNNKQLQNLIEEISMLRYKKIQVMVDFVQKEFNVKIPRDKLEEKIKSITGGIQIPGLNGLFK